MKFFTVVRQQNYCLAIEKSLSVCFSVLLYINSVPRSMQLHHIPKTESLHGITCNDDLHKGKGKLQHFFFLASPNTFLAFSNCREIFFPSSTDHNLSSLIPKCTTLDVLCLQLPSQALHKQHRSMQQSLASQAREGTAVSLLLPSLGATQPVLLAAFGRTCGIQQKGGSHLSIPRRAESCILCCVRHAMKGRQCHVSHSLLTQG